MCLSLHVATNMLWRIQNFIIGGGDCRAPKFEFLPEKGGFLKLFWCILGWLLRWERHKKRHTRPAVLILYHSYSILDFMQKLLWPMGGRPPPPESATVLVERSLPNSCLNPASWRMVILVMTKTDSETFDFFR